MEFLSKEAPRYWTVPSATQDGVLYVVDIRKGRCSCPHYQRVGQFCKHMLAVRFSKHIAFAVDAFAQRTSQTAALFRWLATGEGGAHLSHKDIADVGIKNECADDPPPKNNRQCQSSYLRKMRSSRRPYTV
jgi:predicted transcriptional regulator